MKLILGDVHGFWPEMAGVITAAERSLGIDRVIQVGDFGIGFPGNREYDGGSIAAPIAFIEGNHDNHELLGGSPNLPREIRHVSRGTVETVDGQRCLFVGGASSVDRRNRTWGRDWWIEERITYAQIGQAINAAEAAGGIDMVVSHEAPEQFGIRAHASVDPESAGQRQLLGVLFETLRPRSWVFGHHHIPQDGWHDGCRWFCAPDVRTGRAVLMDGPSLYWFSSR